MIVCEHLIRLLVFIDCDQDRRDGTAAGEPPEQATIKQGFSRHTKFALPAVKIADAAGLGAATQLGRHARAAPTALAAAGGTAAGPRAPAAAR